MSGYFKPLYFLSFPAITISLCLFPGISRYFNLWLHGATYLATWIFGWSGASLVDEQTLQAYSAGGKDFILDFFITG